MPVVVVVNKIDRHDAATRRRARPRCSTCCELEASDEQTDFASLYAVGKDGMAKRSLDDEGSDLTPLFEAILETVPQPTDDPRANRCSFLVTNVEHDDYVGRLAIGRISLRPARGEAGDHAAAGW